MVQSDDLLTAELTTMPLSECNETYLDYNQMAHSIEFQHGVSESQYCAYDQMERGDSCKGDSGAFLKSNKLQYFDLLMFSSY